MLHLASVSSANWLDVARNDLPEVLLDHAHLEKKAASAALAFIFRYPDHPEILASLSALAREELEHYERVLDLLKARAIPYQRQRPGPYAGKLRLIERKVEPLRFLDSLLCCAVIEARSCERMSLLASTLTEPDLVELYGSLLASEARHHQLYLDIASSIFGRETVVDRLAEITTHEATVLAEAPVLARLLC